MPARIFEKGLYPFTVEKVEFFISRNSRRFNDGEQVAAIRMRLEGQPMELRTNTRNDALYDQLVAATGASGLMDLVGKEGLASVEKRPNLQFFGQYYNVIDGFVPGEGKEPDPQSFVLEGDEVVSVDEQPAEEVIEEVYSE